MARFGCISVAFVQLVFGGIALAQAAADASDGKPPLLHYSAGRGLQVGNTGLSLGGYINIKAKKPERRRAEFELDDLAIFVNWQPHPRLRFFSEPEMEEAVVVDDQGHERADPKFLLERLYVDYVHSDMLNVRIGKFLTPMGVWNPIHASPLVPTVSRPLTTSEFFDPFATGLMLYGGASAENLEIEYSAYAQVTNQLVQEREGDERAARRTYGMRAQLADGRAWRLGFSSLALENEGADRWEYVGGSDFLWQWDRLELWIEFALNTPLDRHGSTTWGVYVQPTLQLWGDFYAVARYEHVRLEEPEPHSDIVVLGLDYRPWAHVVVKTEYALTSGDVEKAKPGFQAAFAVLF